MLARLGRANGVFGMHTVRQTHHHSIDILVVMDAFDVFVAVDGGLRNVVFCGDSLSLIAMSTDQAGDFSGRALCDSAHVMVGDAAQADNAIADLPGCALSDKGKWGK